MRFPALALTLLVALAFPFGCNVDARPLADEPTYHDEVQTILDAKCARCHAGDAPAGGYRTNDYEGAIGCTLAGAPATLPAGASPLVRALAQPNHRDLVTPGELLTLTRWVTTGTQSVRAGVHPRSFADPRSASGHAAALRATHYRPLHDPTDPDACAQCHEGAGPRPANITTAPGATACTSCHAEAGGVNACATCHGAPASAYPPRNACFYPTDLRNDAHAAHSTPSAAHLAPLDCSTCHPRPELGAFTGAHTNGHVEVWFDQTVAGRLAHFDGHSCTGTCHDRGGTTPTPAWTNAPPSDCNSCHASPPKAHYEGPCTGCHREANGAGTALMAPTLHVNGKVDLGDGSGGCGACHGSGSSPWPSTGAHAAHMAPANAAPVACETCHAVPSANEPHPTRAGAAVVRLAGLATKGARPATYDAATQTCAATYCHASAGGTQKAPRWTDGPAAVVCGSCHSTPPPPPHSQATACSASSCHAGITTDTLAISAGGRAVHVNGILDHRLP